jgi:hypothetical protein
MSDEPPAYSAKPIYPTVATTAPIRSVAAVPTGNNAALISTEEPLVMGMRIRSFLTGYAVVLLLLVIGIFITISVVMQAVLVIHIISLLVHALSWTFLIFACTTRKEVINHE